MSYHRIEIVYSIPTGTRGRPAHYVMVKRLPVTRGPLMARITNLVNKVLPVKANFEKVTILS